MNQLATAALIFYLALEEEYHGTVGDVVITLEPKVGQAIAERLEQAFAEQLFGKAPRLVGGGGWMGFQLYGMTFRWPVEPAEPAEPLARRYDV